RILRVAASELAQHRLAQEEPVGLKRCAGGGAPARAGAIIRAPMKLLAALISPYTRKVRIVLAEKKIDCDMQIVDVNPVDNPVNPHNTLGKVATLVSGQEAD